METRGEFDDVIRTLKRQRVRQGDLRPVLDCVIEQAIVLRRLAVSAAVDEVAIQMSVRAQTLRRSHQALPKFVVEDLIEESIAELEKAFARSPRSGT